MNHLNQASNAIAGSAGKAPSTRPQTELDIASGVMNDLSALTGRLEGLAEKLCGPQCETSGLTAGPEYPMGVLPRLGFEAIHARGRLADAHRAIERIESALP